MGLYKFPLAYTQTPYGPFIYLPMDEYVGQSLEKYGWYSPSEARFLQRLVQPGWRVANIGAQMGYMARVFADAGCKVDAFEPQPGMFDVLRANTVIGPDARCFNIALGKETKTIQVPHFNYSKPANFGAIDSSHWKSGNKIQQDTLDGWGSEYDLIQIDAEGMERDILEGGKELIARTRPVLFLENDKAATGTQLIEYLDSINYRCYWLVTPLFEEDNPANNNENIFPGCATFNMVCFGKQHPISKHEVDMEDFCKQYMDRVTATDKIGEGNKLFKIT